MKASFWHSAALSLLLSLPDVQGRLQRASWSHDEGHPHSGVGHASRFHNTHSNHKRANPACLKSVEASCSSLAASCVDSINSGNRNNMWSFKPCVAAATCYGVGDLIGSVNCQTGLNIQNQDQAALNYESLYAAIVGDCAWASGGCPITQQNFIDFYYHSLDVAGSSQWPSSANVVIGYWSGVTAWTATGNTVPYTNFNDYLHYSSYPPATNPSSPPNPSGSNQPSNPAPSTSAPVTTPPDPNQPQTSIPWNPNPVPSSGAPSQTFVRSSSTVVIAIPTATTTITVGGATITVAPGGTPVGSVPADVTFPNAVTPTWNSNPIIPTSQSSATFVSGTWTSIVALPTTSDVPVRVNGPPDDDDDDDDDYWFLILGLAGVVIVGTIPAGVTVVGGVIPVPVPPPNWPPVVPWVPPPTGGDPDDPDDDDDDENNSCPLYFPDLPTEPDEDNIRETRRSILVARAPRELVLRRCNGPNGLPITYNGGGTGAELKLASHSGVKWFTVNTVMGTLDASTTLKIHPATAQAAKPIRGPINTMESTIHEHLFEFRYISDFLEDQFTANDCAWLQEFLAATDELNRPYMARIYDQIDQPANSVWTDDVMNKVKSSVSNNDSPNVNDPPQSALMDRTNDWVPPHDASWYKIEMYIKSFAMLGQYFGENNDAFRATGERIQRILAEYTPTTPLNPPLDTRFHTYATQTFGAYNDRVQTRGIGMLAYYKNKMNTILNQKRLTTGNPALQVPQCFHVYHSQAIGGVGGVGGIFSPVGAVNPHSVFVNDLIPQAITHPICNTAGTEGDLHFRYANNVPVLTAGNPTPRYKVMGVGKEFYGLSRIIPGANGNSYSWLIITRTAACPNVEMPTWVPATTNLQGHTKVEFRADCLGATTLTARAKLTPVDANGANRECYLYNYNDGSNEFQIFCGTQANVDACIATQNGLYNSPNGARGDLDLHFQP